MFYQKKKSIYLEENAEKMVLKLAFNLEKRLLYFKKNTILSGKIKNKINHE